MDPNQQAAPAPVDPAAHGRRAADFPGIFRIRPKSTEPTEYLADIGAGGVLRVLFLLAASADHDPDPSVMPTPDALSETVRAALQSYIDRHESSPAT
jgi:hypothetical protein